MQPPRDEFQPISRRRIKLGSGGQKWVLVKFPCIGSSRAQSEPGPQIHIDLCIRISRGVVSSPWFTFIILAQERHGIWPARSNPSGLTEREIRSALPVTVTFSPRV